MSALDSNALIIEHGNLFVGDDAGSAVNVGAVRNVRFTGEQVRTRIESDNRGTIINKVRLQGKVEFDLLEVGNMAVLENIFKGIVSLSSVAASIVNNYQQIISAGDWAYDTFIPFDYQDADGSYINMDSVTLSTDGVIVLNTDYFKTYDEATKKWGITIRDSSTVTTLSQTVTIQFDYTPAASQVITGGGNQTATPRYVKIEGPSEDNSAVMRTVELDEAVASSPMLIPFVEVENANDVGVMPVTFESNKGTAFTITDEINPT